MESPNSVWVLNDYLNVVDKSGTVTEVPHSFAFIFLGLDFWGKRDLWI